MSDDDKRRQEQREQEKPPPPDPGQMVKRSDPMKRSDGEGDDR